jgi:hypothetical protein
LDRDGKHVAASTVTDTIYDPCDKILIWAGSMTSDTPGPGRYYYNYPIQSTATYGRYKTIVTAINATGKISKFESEFFVMPWKITTDIRQITGISETKSISDDDLSDIAWNAYRYALHDVFTHHIKSVPLNNVETGAGFDGSNSTFQTSCYPIADIYGDGTVTGWSSSCVSDITGYWIASTGHYYKARVGVSEARNGEITIFQVDGTSPIPSTNKGVYLDYWSEYEEYDSELFRRAVSYLAAHEVVNRFNELDRTTIADLNSNRPIIISNPLRFMAEYRRYISMIRKPRIGSA